MSPFATSGTRRRSATKPAPDPADRLDRLSPEIGGPHLDPTTRTRSTEMSSLHEALSRLRQAELVREADEQRLAESLHRARRLERRAGRARQRSERASRRARLALVRAG